MSTATVSVSTNPGETVSTAVNATHAHEAESVSRGLTHRESTTAALREWSVSRPSAHAHAGRDSRTHALEHSRSRTPGDLGTHAHAHGIRGMRLTVAATGSAQRESVGLTVAGEPRLTLSVACRWLQTSSTHGVLGRLGHAERE